MTRYNNVYMGTRILARISLIVSYFLCHPYIAIFKSKESIHITVAMVTIEITVVYGIFIDFGYINVY